MRYLIVLILITYSHVIQAQVFDNDQAHPRIKWKHIQTKKFNLIFAEEFSKQAPKLADQLLLYIDQNSSKFPKRIHRTPIIIQSNHLQQNGFVMLAPRKSEIYSTPSGTADNQEWLPNLALHESRHIIQFDNLTGNFSNPFLQQLGLALFATNLPSWYFEGDATSMETMLSDGGRGRLASWNMPIRANILSGKNYNFNKYVHGSFKDIIPSYYNIGYHMVSELQDIDPMIHPKMMDEMNGKLLRPFNFQRALKKHSGMWGNQLFKRTMNHLKSAWNSQDSSYQNSSDNTDKYPTNYYLPQVANNQLLALKDSRQDNSFIISLDQNNLKKQTKLTAVGQQLTPYYHAEKHLITWDEYRRDVRYQKQSYQAINVYNTQSKSYKTIAKNTRYYTPVISPDLKNIACIQVNESNQTSLVVLDITNGKVLNTIPAPEGMHLQQPQYDIKGENIVAIAISQKGTNLIEINLQDKDFRELLNWNFIQYERPIYYGKDIVFKASYKEKDDIFTIKNGQIIQLTQSSFGAFNPTIVQDTLYYNDYTTNGYKIKKQSIHKTIQHISEFPKPKTLFPKQELVDYKHVPDSNNHEIKDYSITRHSINFHSISFSGNDFESFDNLKPGIFWLSNDVMGTTQVKLGYEYDLDIRKSQYSASLSYQRYFPKFSISYNNIGQISEAKRKDGTLVPFDWREHIVNLDMSIPLSLSRRNYSYSFGLNTGTSYVSRYNISLEGLSNFYTSMAFPLNYQVYLNRNRHLSMMDLQPKWGQNISFTYRHMPFETELTGTTWSVRTNFYAPGLIKNHGIQIRASIQEKSGRYSYNNDIPLPQGYSFYLTGKLKNTILSTYRLPLAYPDWSVGSLAYIKRIRADVTADYQNIQTSTISPKSISIGTQIDLNFFKYPLPEFTLGGRLIYINDDKSKQKIVPSFSFNYSY